MQSKSNRSNIKLKQPTSKHLEDVQRDIDSVRKLAYEGQNKIIETISTVKDSNNQSPISMLQLTNDPRKPKRISEAMYSTGSTTIERSNCLKKDEFVKLIIDEAGSALIEFHKSCHPIDSFLSSAKRQLVQKFAIFQSKIYSYVDTRDVPYYFLMDYSNGMLREGPQMAQKIDELCAYFGGEKQLTSNLEEPITGLVNEFLDSVQNQLIQMESSIKAMTVDAAAKKKEEATKKKDADKILIEKLKKNNVLSDSTINWNLAKLLESNVSLQESVTLLNECSNLKSIQTLKMEMDFTQPMKNKEGELTDALARICRSEIVASRLDEKFVQITSNNYSQIPGSVFNMLKNFRFITAVDLNFSGGKSQISDSGIETFAKTMKDMTMVKHFKLNLSDGANSITDKGIVLVSKSIQEMTFLASLQLCFAGGKNKITNSGIQALAESFNARVSLAVLHLDFSNGNNEVTDQGLEHLGKSLVGLQQLTNFKLDLSGGKNSVKDAQIKLFSLVLRNMKLITDLTLGFGYSLST